MTDRNSSKSSDSSKSSESSESSESNESSESSESSKASASVGRLSSYFTGSLPLLYSTFEMPQGPTRFLFGLSPIIASPFQSVTTRCESPISWFYSNRLSPPPQATIADVW